MSKIALVRTIADKLKSASTQSEKREVLEYYSSESLFRRVLFYTYNPMINFNMDDWTPRHVGKQDGQGISKFMHVPEDIYQGKFTQEEAEFACNMAMMHINDQEAELFVGMLKKDLGLDLDAETINCVWEDLIPSYPIRQASEFNTASPAKFETYIKPVIVAQKMSEGLRVNIIVRGNNVEFRQKDGTLIHGWDMWTHQFSTLAQQNAIVFDGHAKVVDEDLNVVAMSDEEVLAASAENIRFTLWDTIRYDGFVQGVDNRVGYNWRFNGLEHMMLLAIEKNPTPCYQSCEYQLVQDFREALHLAKSNKCSYVAKNMSATWATGVTDEEIIVSPESSDLL